MSGFEKAMVLIGIISSFMVICVLTVGLASWIAEWLSKVKNYQTVRLIERELEHTNGRHERETAELRDEIDRLRLLVSQRDAELRMIGTPYRGRIATPEEEVDVDLCEYEESFNLGGKHASR